MTTVTGYSSSVYGVADNEWRSLLIGKTGVGKSATGNNILGKNAFISKTSAKSVTKKSQIGRAERFGRKLLMVDTPGVFDTGSPNEETMKEILKCIGITSPGLHVIILVVNVGRFTQEEKRTVDLFLEHLGENLMRYLIVVFTRRDDLDRQGTSIHQYVETLESESLLCDVLRRCERRYVAFDNTATGSRNDDQVKELLSMIESLVSKNGGGYYTNEMYEEAEKSLRKRIEEEQKKLKKEEEEKIKTVVASYKSQLDADKKYREKMSERLAAAEIKSRALEEDHMEKEAKLERIKRKADREAEERRRLQESSRREKDKQDRRMAEFQEDCLRQQEQRLRDLDIRQKQLEDDIQRREEERERRHREKLEELERAQREEIEKIRQEYAARSSDQTLRETQRDDIQEEKPVWKKILKPVLMIASVVLPKFAPIVNAVRAVFDI